MANVAEVWQLGIMWYRGWACTNVTLINSVTPLCHSIISKWYGQFVNTTMNRFHGNELLFFLKFFSFLSDLLVNTRYIMLTIEDTGSRHPADNIVMYDWRLAILQTIVSIATTGVSIATKDGGYNKIWTYIAMATRKSHGNLSVPWQRVYGDENIYSKWTSCGISMVTSGNHGNWPSCHG